jgi:hypothetical protein
MEGEGEAAAANLRMRSADGTSTEHLTKRQIRALRDQTNGHPAERTGDPKAAEDTVQALMLRGVRRMPHPDLAMKALRAAGANTPVQADLSLVNQLAGVRLKGDQTSKLMPAPELSLNNPQGTDAAEAGAAHRVRNVAPAQQQNLFAQAQTEPGTQTDLGNVESAIRIMKEKELKAAPLPPGASVTGYLYYPVGDYDRAKVQLMDVAAQDLESFLVDF